MPDFFSLPMIQNKQKQYFCATFFAGISVKDSICSSQAECTCSSGKQCLNPSSCECPCHSKLAFRYCLGEFPNSRLELFQYLFFRGLIHHPSESSVILHVIMILVMIYQIFLSRAIDLSVSCDQIFPSYHPCDDPQFSNPTSITISSFKIYSKKREGFMVVVEEEDAPPKQQTVSRSHTFLSFLRAWQNI